ERGKLLVRAGQPQKALVAFDAVAATGGEAEASEALYQRGRTLDDIGRRAEAAAAYRAVATGYPSREVAAASLWRLGLLAWVAGDPGFARVELLRRIGLVEDALGELDDLAERAAGDPMRLYGISSAYVKEERYHLALRIFRRAFVPFAATGDPALPPAFWETFYPVGWRAEMMAAAKSAGLDPYLVAAVVREESNYYPRALSRAGARGLMQLMPETALPMAPTKSARGDHLDDPVQNLQLR